MIKINMNKISDRLNLKSIQSKLLLIICIILTISSTIISVSIIKILNKEKDTLDARLFENDIRGISQAVNYLIDSEINKLNGYVYDEYISDFLKINVQDIVNNNGEADKRRLVENRLLNNNKDSSGTIEATYIINKDGIITASTEENAFLADVSEKAYFKDIKDGNIEFFVSELIVSEDTNNNINVISRRINDENGNFLGLVCQDVISTLYNSILEEYNIDRFIVCLTDEEGRVIYHPNKELIGNILDDNLMADKNSNEKLQVLNYEENGEEKVSYVGVIKKTGWSVYSTGYVDDIKATSKMATQSSLVLSLVILGIAVATIYYFTKRIILPIREVTSSMITVSEGDLTVKVSEIKSGDEVEYLSSALNSTTGKLSTLISEVDESINVVLNQAQHLASINEELSASNENITEAINGVSSDIVNTINDVQDCEKQSYELREAIENLNENNSDINNQNTNVSVTLKESVEKLEHLTIYNDEALESFDNLKNTIEELLMGIKDIAQFLDTINSITDQINLLSLNARIESARAGEYGKGFAVVADEIGTLSRSTGEAANGINNIIGHIDKLVEDTKENLRDTENINNEEKASFEAMERSFKSMSLVLNEMIKSTDSISKNIDIVNNKQENVSTSISNISKTFENIAAVSEEVNASANEQKIVFDSVNKSAEELQLMSEKAKDSLGCFKI